MPGNKFIDTNIILYLLSNDSYKKTLSKKIIREDCCISTQVMGEFSNVCLRKFNMSLEDTETALRKIVDVANVAVLNDETVFFALKLKQKYKFQFFDSLILAAAIENNCTVLYSEDMQHKQIIENKLEIVNPFIGL